MKKATMVSMIALLMVVAVGCGRAGPVEAFNEFVHEIQFGPTSVSEVRDMVSKDTNDYYSSDYDFENWFLTRAERYVGDGATITAEDVIEEADVARLKYKSEGMGGQTFTAKLLREDGKWKVEELLSTDEVLEGAEGPY